MVNRVLIEVAAKLMAVCFEIEPLADASELLRPIANAADVAAQKKSGKLNYRVSGPMSAYSPKALVSGHPGIAAMGRQRTYWPTLFS